MSNVVEYIFKKTYIKYMKKNSSNKISISLTPENLTSLNDNMYNKSKLINSLLDEYFKEKKLK